MHHQRALIIASVLLCTVFGASNACAEDDLPAPISAVQYAADMTAAPVRSVAKEVHHDTLPSLRNASMPKGDTSERINFEGPLPLPPGATNQTDGAVQGTPRAPLPATPAPLTSFDGNGLGFVGPQGAFVNRWVPPDTNGAIGSTQYVQTVNDQMAVFDKATQAVLYGPVPENILWVGFGGGCEVNNDGDPVVVYDKAADRWVVSQFSITNNKTYGYLQCVAVSQTNDATGAWNRYAFTYTQFPDYPKMGVWPDAYYTTFNMFQGNHFKGANLCAYDRAAMLAGNAATQQCFQLASSFGGVLPADLDGPTAPPAGAPNYLLNFGTNALNLWKFHVDWANTANTTLTGPTSIAVANFAPACSGGVCIPQSGTTQQLDSLADRLMFRLAYRNFGSHESLVVSHSVTAGAGSGVRWYEIRSPGTTPVVYQQSTYAPDNTLYRWMPSAAMDHDGNLALGYSTSGSTAFPSVAYAARLATDTPSTLGAEVTMVAGTGAQGGASRWGDYSAMTIDPTDDCTFWYTNEYVTAAANGTKNWSTRIGSFKFPSCGATRVPAQLAFQIQPNANYAAGATIAVTVAVEDSQGLRVDTDASAITLALQGGNPSATLGGTTTVNAVNGVATFNVSVDLVGAGYTLHATDGALAPADSTAFEITAGAPAAINFSVGPADAIAGAVNNAPTGIVVHVQDASSNPVVGDIVGLSVETGPGSVTVTNPQLTDANGNATFSDAVVTEAGTYTLYASENFNALTTTSNSFVVSPAPPQLVFTLQPFDVVQGSVLNTVTVTKQDAYGNVYAADTDAIDFSVSACGGFALGSVNLDGSTGTATLSPQRFYTAVANPPGLQITAGDTTAGLSVQSNSFAVTASGEFLFASGFESCRP